MSYTIEQYEDALLMIETLAADTELIEALTSNYNGANFGHALKLTEVAVNCKIALQRYKERGEFVNIAPLDQFASEAFKPRKHAVKDNGETMIEIGTLNEAAEFVRACIKEDIDEADDSHEYTIEPPAPAFDRSIDELYSALNDGGVYVIVFKKKSGEITTRRAVSDPGIGCYNKGGSKLPADRLLFWDCDAMAKKSAVLSSIISFDSEATLNKKVG